MEVIAKIEEWAKERGITEADPIAQTVKLGEEYGEICKGLSKNKRADTLDAIGDVGVVLTILSVQLGTTLEDCMNLAYNEIKDRRGKTVNGVFVKEADLSAADLENK